MSMTISATTTPADLSRDPVYRGLVQASRSDPASLSVLNDYREERGLPPLGAGLATNELRCVPGDTVASLEAAIKRQEGHRRHQAQQKREQAFASKRAGVALSVGEAFHARIMDLYVSKRASVALGAGGQEELDWEAYGKRGYHNPHTGKKQPAKWRNGGARVVGYGRSGRIVLENHRGKEVARLPMLPRDAVTGNHRGLVAGDLFLINREVLGVKVAIRYGLSYTGNGANQIATGYVRTGVTVQFPVPEDCRQQGSQLFGVFKTTDASYWEHGRDLGQCRAEYARKLELAQQAREAVRLSARLERASHLITQLCGRLEVTVADARSCGYCVAGIGGFTTHHGITGESVSAAQLRATGDAAVALPIDDAARRVALARFGDK